MSNHRGARGAISLEAAIGAVVFLLFIGAIVDYGLLIHRQSMLFDITLKTVQEVSRDTRAATSEGALHDRALELFGQHALRLAANRANELSMTDASVSCGDGTVSIQSEWSTGCVMCVLNRFQKVLHAKSAAMIETDLEDLCGSDFNQ